MDVGGLVKWVWICEVSEEGFVFVCGDARGEVTTSRRVCGRCGDFLRACFLRSLVFGLEAAFRWFVFCRDWVVYSSASWAQFESISSLLGAFPWVEEGGSARVTSI